MDACIITSGTGNAFPKDTGNSQAICEGCEVTRSIDRFQVNLREAIIDESPWHFSLHQLD